ncbi:hypothetical protein NJ7G_3952 [Natrinema sp. J7-2]|nr:hypothetical protein NJ7G_3952 [Natrinema sp. J7-2]
MVTPCCHDRDDSGALVFGPFVPTIVPALQRSRSSRQRTALRSTHARRVQLRASRSGMERTSLTRAPIVPPIDAPEPR